MFGLLLKGTLFPRTFKNRPIWSHCSFRNYKSTFFHLQRMEQGNLRGGQFSIKTHHPVWKGFWLPRCSFLTKCVFFKKMDQPLPLFVFFVLFKHKFYWKNCRLQRDSRRRRARWPLDHHNGPEETYVFRAASDYLPMYLPNRNLVAGIM